MLEKDREKRITIAKALEHPFFNVLKEEKKDVS